MPDNNMYLIRDKFDSNLNIKITPNLANAIIKFVKVYENRDKHPEAFNSPYLGLYPCYFLTKDRDDFFNLFNTDNQETQKLLHGFTYEQNKTLTDLLFKARKLSLSEAQHSMSIAGLTNNEIKTQMKNIPAINANFKTASDPFNVFAVYLVYKLMNSTIPDKLKKDAAHSVLLLLEYKFFTSLVNHRFKYRPDEGTMIATYESVSGKFDIKQYGTWRNVLSVRADSFLSADSIHYATLISGGPDLKLLYVITDIQTRIRNQINIFTEEFMKIKETKDKIGEYSLTVKDDEGNQNIADLSSTYDTMIFNVYRDVMSIPHFLDDTIIRLIVKFFSSLNNTNFRNTLIGFSEYAVKQARSGQQLLVKTIDGVETDIGAQAIISMIIQKTYRYLTNTNVNIRDISSVIKSTKDVYGSSRVSDEGIVRVRNDMVYLINQIQNSTRESTVTSLRIAFVLYIVILAFKYNK